MHYSRQLSAGLQCRPVHPQLDAVIEDLQSAEQRFRALRLALSRDAWHRRPGPAQWSAAECVAHVTMTSAALQLLADESGTLSRTPNSDRVVEAGVLVDVDKLARAVPKEKLPELVTELRTAVKAGENINDNLATLRRKFVPTP